VKIFYVNPMSRNNLAQYDINLLESLSNLDDDLKIRYFCSEGVDYQLKNISKFPIFSYFIHRRPIIKAVYYIITLFKFFFITAKDKPDLIHFQWLKIPVIDLTLLFFLERFLNVKCFLTVHNLIPHRPNFLDKVFYALIYRTVSGLFVHENHARKKLVDIFGIPDSRITTIPHGPLRVRPRPFESLSNDVTSIVSRSKNIVLCMGRLSNYKGIDLLIESWAEMPQEYLKQFTLVFAGTADDSITANVRQQIHSHPNTFWINRYLTDTDLHHLIESSSAIVIPYKRISQSGVLFTAIGHEKPFLVTDIGGLTDPLNVAKIGWSCAPDVHSLKNGIQDMCEVLLRGGVVCESNWHKVRQIFSWDLAARVTLDGYKI